MRFGTIRWMKSCYIKYKQRSKWLCRLRLIHYSETRLLRTLEGNEKRYVLASAPLHTQDTEIGLGALVWQLQPSFSISDRSCLVAEKSRQNASRIARQKKMKTGCERHGERESERRREDRATKRGRTRKTIRCYQSEQWDMVRAEQTGCGTTIIGRAWWNHKDNKGQYNKGQGRLHSKFAT